MNKLSAIIKQIVLSVFIIINILACDKTENAGSLLTQSDSNIVNGIITELYPSVILIRNGLSMCTATAVSHSTIITAGHCMGEGHNGGIYFVDKYNKSHYAVAAISSDKVDAAVVVFANGTFNSYSAILNRTPNVSDTLVLVGFGQSDYINNNPIDGHKRVGRNKIIGFADRSGLHITHQESQGDYLHFRSQIVSTALPGDEVMTGRGDSGGPLFIEGQLAGVVSFGGTRSQLNQFIMLNEPNPSYSLIYEYDTNLTSESAKELILRAKSEINAEF